MKACWGWENSCWILVLLVQLFCLGLTWGMSAYQAMTGYVMFVLMTVLVRWCYFGLLWSTSTYRACWHMRACQHIRKQQDLSCLHTGHVCISRHGGISGSNRICHAHLLTVQGQCLCKWHAVSFIAMLMRPTVTFLNVFAFSIVLRNTVMWFLYCSMHFHQKWGGCTKTTGKGRPAPKQIILGA